MQGCKWYVSTSRRECGKRAVLSKGEWENAAKLKNCKTPAAKQKCVNASEFVYHCVIDGFQKETLEVCAPRKLIHGNILTYFVEYIEFLKLSIILSSKLK